MLLSLVYFVLRRLLVVLAASDRSDLEREVELLVLRHQVKVLRFVKITRSTCFGDSGGPLFRDCGTVVGINNWTLSYWCDGRNFAYRVDAPTAQAFLGRTYGP